MVLALIGFGILVAFQGPLAGLVNNVGFLGWKKTTPDELTAVTAHTKTKKSLLDENKSLKDRVQELELKMLNHSLVEEENELLRTLLGRVRDLESGVMARILKRPAESPYDTLIIDAGFQREIKEGMLVYAHGEVLIGTVLDVYAKTSKVKLFSSPGTRVPIRVGDVSGTAEGMGGGNFTVELPQSIAVEEGGVITKDDAPQVPLGVVESINLNEIESLQTLLFTLPVNFYVLNEVFVTAPEFVIDPEHLLPEETEEESPSEESSEDL